MNEEDIKSMSDQELSKLVAAISAERKVREARTSGLIHITFESSFVDTRKAKGWAARLITNEDGTIERKFIETTRNWSKGGYNFWFEGDFEAGAILEIWVDLLGKRGGPIEGRSKCPHCGGEAVRVPWQGA